MVPTSSIIAIIFNMVFGIALGAFLVLILKKFRISLRPFLIGCAVWFVFAMILEQFMHLAVLQSPVGGNIQSSKWLYALYGGLAAGVFEESGRFLAMKYLLRKEHGDDRNALSYGAGHGGFEAVFLLITGMINNLVYSVMINNGTSDQLLSTLDGAQAEALQKAFDSLIQSSPATFIVGPVERISAVILHIALSVLVWLAVTRKKTWLFPLAVFLHAFVDGFVVILSKSGVGMLPLEAIVFVMAASIAALAWYLWKAERN